MVRCDCTCEDDLHYRVHLANGAGEKLLQLMMHDTVFSAKAFTRAVSLLVFYDSGRDIAFNFFVAVIGPSCLRIAVRGRMCNSCMATGGFCMRFHICRPVPS